MKSSSPNKKTSIVGFCLSLVVKCILWLLACGCIPLLITTVLLVFMWRHNGLVYTDQLFHAQLVWMDIIGAHLYWGQSILDRAVLCVQGIQHATVNFSTINEFPNTVHYLAFKQIAAFICPIITVYGSAFIMTTQLTVLRIATVLLFVPIFLLLGSIGIIDGLIQRHLRRINGGRESALVYHHARNAVLPTLFLTSFIYVVLPLNILPMLLLIPGAILFAMLLFFTTKTFKKYL